MVNGGDDEGGAEILAEGPALGIGAGYDIAEADAVQEPVQIAFCRHRHGSTLPYLPFRYRMAVPASRSPVPSVRRRQGTETLAQPAGFVCDPHHIMPGL